MTQTFTMPDTLEDELDEIIDAEFQVDDETAREILAPDNTIDVPIRKSSKAIASVTVEQAADGSWRVGWKWTSTKKTDPVDGCEMTIDNQMSFPDRRSAVASGLRLMAANAVNFNEKLHDDIMKFHNADWFVIEDDGDSVAETPGTPIGQDGANPPDAVPAKDSPEPAKPQPKSLDQAAADFKAAMRDASDEFCAAALARMTAEAGYKMAKAEEKSAAEKLQKIVSRGPEHYPLFEGSAKPTSDAHAAAESAAEKPATPSEPAADQDAWKSVSIEVLDFADGLHGKLAGDGLDTIGRLEQRRADISDGKEKWPKGVGKAAVSKIEDAIIGWLTENRDRKSFAEPTEQSASETTSEVTSDEASNSQPAESDSDPKSPSADGGIGDIQARAQELIKEEITVSDPTNEIYQGGREAFGRGFNLVDCPWVPGERQDLWILGFMDAKEDAKDDAEERASE